MALIESFMQKTVTLSATQGFALTAKVGQSILVTGIRVYGSANNYVSILIDKVGVGFFRVGGVAGNHLAYSQKTLATDTGDITSATGLTNVAATLFDYMKEVGGFAGYPVAEGQTFSIAEYGSSTPTAVITVTYQIGAAGDYKADDPNGSDAKEYTYVSYGRAAAALAVDASTALTVAANPPEYLGFPWTNPVPANKTVELLGIVGSVISCTGDASNQGIRTTYLKLIQDREVLCDDDRVGLMFRAKTPAGSADAVTVGEGYTLVGGLSTVDTRQPFSGLNGLVFSSGEDLDVYINTEHVGTTAGTPKTIAAASSEIGLVLRVKTGGQ